MTSGYSILGKAAAALVFFGLAGCIATADAPVEGSESALPEDSAVALGQPVMIGELVLTPMRVTQDSRCPINARCTHAGTIIVETRINGSGWRETVSLLLANPLRLRGYSLSLVSVEPGQVAGAGPIDPARYRFTFEGQSIP
ncbi:MAG: hypothetical protein P1U62_10445 [Alteraurantiacibacter sp. bin_em_oilr2.035]|nr:hypothetical protein [Alteraurantiacibacter sp. bin_em_oilr2.035]